MLTPMEGRPKSRSQVQPNCAREPSMKENKSRVLSAQLILGGREGSRNIYGGRAIMERFAQPRVAHPSDGQSSVVLYCTMLYYAILSYTIPYHAVVRRGVALHGRRSRSGGKRQVHSHKGICICCCCAPICLRAARVSHGVPGRTGALGRGTGMRVSTPALINRDEGFQPCEGICLSICLSICL